MQKTAQDFWIWSQWLKRHSSTKLLVFKISNVYFIKKQYTVKIDVQRCAMIWYRTDCHPDLVSHETELPGAMFRYVGVTACTNYNMAHRYNKKNYSEGISALDVHSVPTVYSCT